VLEGSLDNLVGPMESSSLHRLTSSKEDCIWNEALYMDAMKALSYILEENSSSLRLKQVISLANEIYKYALAKSSSHADEDFTKWLVGRSV
jgi:hypothetical protein